MPHLSVPAVAKNNKHCVHTVLNPRRIISLAETRKDILFYYRLGNLISQNCYKARANLDAHLVFVRGNDKEHAVFRLGAETPNNVRADMHIPQWVALQRRNGDDHDLVGVIELQCFDLGPSSFSSSSLQQLRFINDVTGELRNFEWRTAKL